MRLLHLSPPPPWTNIFNLNWNFTIGIKFLKNYPRFLPYSFNLVLIVDDWYRSANLQISLRTEVEVKDFRVDLTIFEKKLQRISHPFCSGPQVSSFCVHTFPAVAGILARFPFDSSKPVFSESIAFYASRQCGFRLLSLCYNDSLLFRNRLISAQSRWFIPNVCAKPIHAARSGFSTCADRTQDFTCR